ncbi:MAG: TIGR03960 family B12-binding radical SAM protein [Deltaproteobacteria bacterium]|jgi:radical SAM family uncharacterized protein/radical SAM-linked protein|nr:TIGR03960 family B12-binding radical SAM protein [Deltaproteobacteria bacterium]
MDSKFFEMLCSVNKPYRYIGGELNSRKKAWDSVDIHICLVFPDSYEIGTSHIGLSILYNVANDRDDILAERAFTPWADMEEALSSRGIKLFSLESNRALDEFDILGFSLGYELTYTNVLTVLKSAGIPIYSKDRDESHPLIIAGGPCTYNPEPVAAFFDAIAIGDGEGLVVEISEMAKVSKKEDEHRGDLLRRLARISGVYVPSLGNMASGVGRALQCDINSAPYPVHPVVPYATTQMRAAVEVSRGCARGCRFCQAGFIYRPVRQRDSSTVSKIASECILSTGYEEFSFLSLSLGDWAPLESALRQVHEACAPLPVDASLPSLRVESMSDRMLSSMGSSRSGSFTLAPEAGTERMRNLINKGNTDQDLYVSVEKIFKNGWQAVKLYFMIGLPDETQDDLKGIVDIANRCLSIGRKYHRRPDVTVSTSTFVPKAHTPFQWERQISIEEAVEKQAYLKKHLRRPGLHYKWHRAEMSFLEGVFARGGAELADVIAIAHEDGARFDGWDEHFDIGRWRRAFAKRKISPDRYLEGRGNSFEFPWDHLKVGPDKHFLMKERDKARRLQGTLDCVQNECTSCGLCDFDEVKNRIASSEAITQDQVSSSASKPQTVKHEIYKYRIQYSKKGRAAFLGGLEVTDTLRFGFRASGLPFRYSEGFHPRIKVSVGQALPVGAESETEFVDIELSKFIDEAEVLKSVERKFPEGIMAKRVRFLKPPYESISDAVLSNEYEVTLSSLGLDLEASISNFDSAEAFPFMRVRGKSNKEVDLKEAIHKLAVLRDGVLGMTILNKPPIIRVSEVLSAVFGVSGEDLNRVMVNKTGVEWKCAVNSDCNT